MPTPENITSALQMIGADVNHIGHIDEDTVFEGPCSFAAINNWGPAYFGAFSYSWSEISEFVINIGRYCSIADNVRLGALEHPSNWATSSSFSYDPGFRWPDWQRFWRDDAAPRFEPVALGHARQKSGIALGHDVWIGTGAFIKSGVKLGTGCIVGANAVVTKDVPPYAIVAGNPAKVIRYRFDEKTQEKLLKLEWWRHHFRDFAGLNISDVEEFIDAVEERRNNGILREYVANRMRLKDIVEEK